MRGSKPTPILFALFVACGAPDMPVEALQGVVPPGAVFDAMQPEPWLTVVLDSEALVESVPALTTAFEAASSFENAVTACPAFVESESGWTAQGACETAAGDRIEGSLSWSQFEGGTQLVGDNFRVWEGEALVMVFDGALEASYVGELLAVEAAVTACGGPAVSCEDGLTALDVSYGAYPQSGVPEAFDVTVAGVVAAPGFEAISVNGAWTIDDTACVGEPTSGTLLIGGNISQALDFDGEFACEGCATRTVAGFAAEPLCDLR